MQNSEHIEKMDRTLFLINSYKKNIISSEELDELNDWRSQTEENESIFQKLLNEQQIGLDLLDTTETDVSWVKKEIFNKITISKKSYTSYWIWAAAAIIGIVVIANGHFFRTKEEKAHTTTSTINNHKAGTNGATITLSDGRIIAFDSSTNRTIATQGNIDIVCHNGKISYIDRTTGKPQMGDNIISTPKGKFCELLLPDNTKIWLNANSQIRFPVVFVGKERKVYIKGEVYFEVAKNEKLPFIVNIDNNSQVEVLGTHFDINAYKDNPKTTTTLMEGSITFKDLHLSENVVKLKPGQQASLISNKKITIRNAEDEMDEILAWKNGKFIFNNINVHELMRIIGRWYNVEINFMDDINDNYSLNVPNNIPLDVLLDYLEKSGGIHFTINKNTVLIKRN